MIRAYLDHFLNDARTTPDLGSAAPVQYYVTGAESWHTASTWPPSSAQKILYLGDQTLSPSIPAVESRGALPFDPNKEDACVQSDSIAFLTYESPALLQPVDVAGTPELIVTVSTTTADADVSATLYERTPQGVYPWSTTQRLRLRFRDGYETPKAMPTGTPTELHLKFNSAGHQFAQGNSIGVILAPSECGLPENPGSIGPIMSSASAQASTVTVHGGSISHSRLVLPVVP
jgi:predicted acyl esterase